MKPGDTVDIVGARVLRTSNAHGPHVKVAIGEGVGYRELWCMPEELRATGGGRIKIVIEAAAAGLVLSEEMKAAMRADVDEQLDDVEQLARAGGISPTAVAELQTDGIPIRKAPALTVANLEAAAAKMLAGDTLGAKASAFYAETRGKLEAALGLDPIVDVVRRETGLRITAGIYAERPDDKHAGRLFSRALLYARERLIASGESGTASAALLLAQMADEIDNPEPDTDR